MSVLTMVMTVPQIWAVWGGARASGVSLATWVTYLVVAVLWLVQGLRKRDPTIASRASAGSFLDAAVVVGVLVHR